MPLSQLVVASAACLILPGPPASAQVGADSPPPARTLGELQAHFRRAQRPAGATLVGRWTMQQMIVREERADGRTIERRFGARRTDIPGQPFEWVLEIQRRPGTGYLVRSHNPWEPTGDSSTIRFRRTDVTFEKEFGSDYPMVYRCRALGARRLVCLNGTGPVWEGREFTKDP